MKKNWQKLLEPIIKEAGDILLSYYQTPLVRHEKKEHGKEYGFVTKADLASEKFLIEQLSGLLTKASFLAEESGKSGSGDHCWVIDPLDGTTNFAHKLPYFCISVALTYKEQPIVGAIYQPTTKEFFYAEQGKGAFLNGQKIYVSSPTRFDQAMVAISLPYDREKRKELVHSAERIAKEAYAIRHYGAIALDLAYVACGRMDGVFFTNLAWWDVAAGMCLIEQAGGIVTDFKGKPVRPDYTTCIAGGKMVHSHVMSLLKG